MDIDRAVPCFFNSSVPSITCGGDQTKLEKFMPSRSCSKDFRSMLEYLLFRAGLFHIKPTNLYQHCICSNHLKYLTVIDRKRCHICKPLREQEITGNNDMRQVSKPIALGIWEEGQPEHNWALYGRPICGKCRKYYENKYLTNEMGKKADTIFDWIYDENVLYSPVPSDLDSDDEEYQPNFNDFRDSVQTNSFKLFKKFFAETGFEEHISKTSSYSSMGRRSQCNFRCQAKKIIVHILNFITDNEADTVWKHFMDDEYETPVDEKNFDVVMDAINTALTETDHYSTKRQILGIIAGDFPLSMLHARFPGINSYQLKAARKHAMSKGRGAPVDTKRQPLERYNEQQVGHFLEFVLSPSITTDIPFGKKSLKLTTGETLDVVNTVRNTISTRIIQQYYSYCQETTSGDFKPLGESSLFAILEGCASSTRKNMAGIDNYAANGSTAFDNLKKICDEMAVFHVSIDKIVQLQKALQQCRNYIKIDYKTHISNSATVADHCSVFGLSDSKDDDWNKECEHAHIDKCEDCLLLDNTLSQIEWIIKHNDEMSEDIRIRHLTLFKRQSHLVKEWKKHQLRSVHQEAARDAVLTSLDENSPFLAIILPSSFLMYSLAGKPLLYPFLQVLLVIDWAMKWIQTKYRQSQSEFFGLKGLPWHVTHVVRVKPSSTTSSGLTKKVFENRTFCHVFNNSLQNGATVISILEDVLKRIKLDHPEIRTAFIRCDNAGCYHGSETLLSLKMLFDSTGIFIRRIDFSEPQAGKGPCDRKAAVIKGQVRRFVNEKNDCMNSADFVAAAKSTKNLSIFSCNFPAEKQNRKVKWEGVSKYNNIEFTQKRPSLSSTRTTALSTSSPLQIEIKTWRAFNIGSGKIFRFSDFKSTSTEIVPLEFEHGAQYIDKSWKCEKSSSTEANMDESMDVDQETIDDCEQTSSSSGFLLWDCPVENCICQYRRYYDLQYHLDTGKHILKGVKMPLLDKAKTMFKTLTENDIQRTPITLQNFNIIQNINGISTVVLSKGWALPLPKTNTRFTELQKEYLIDAYNNGEETGFKSNPETLSLEMPFIKDNGQFIFTPDECLTASQIKSYFSCLTRKRRKQMNNSQEYRNQQMAVNDDQEVNSDDSDNEIGDEEESDDYDNQVAAQQMTNFQRKSKEILKK